MRLEIETKRNVIVETFFVYSRRVCVCSTSSQSVSLSFVLCYEEKEVHPSDRRKRERWVLHDGNREKERERQREETRAGVWAFHNTYTNSRIIYVLFNPEETIKYYSYYADFFSFLD